MSEAICPLCGLPGREAMIPAATEPGDKMPRVRRGLRYECGTTEDVQSRLCALIVERLERGGYDAGTPASPPIPTDR